MKSGGDLKSRDAFDILSLCSHSRSSKYIQKVCIPLLPFLMKRKALAFCMRYGEPSCVLSKKATGLSGDPEQKAELGHSLHLLSQRERERERVASEDTMGR